MDEQVFKRLKRGDLVKHRHDKSIFVVTGNYGDRITATLTVDMTNPTEWEVVPSQKNQHNDTINQHELTELSEPIRHGCKHDYLTSRGKYIVCMICGKKNSEYSIN